MNEAVRFDRDVRELAQAIATLEVVVTGFIVATLDRRSPVQEKFAARLRTMADAAVFERDGLEPVMLDRVADRLAVQDEVEAAPQAATEARSGDQATRKR